MVTVRIRLNNLTKEFDIKASEYSEVISFIDYYESSSQNETYSFKNKIAFNIVDLFLSSLAVPRRVFC